MSAFLTPENFSKVIAALGRIFKLNVYVKICQRFRTQASNSMQNYDRPTLQEINDLLRQHTALIVHFSGTPKGSGSEYDYHYPEDLKRVIAGFGQGGLSCSTVMPNDKFVDLNSKIANSTGCIGVILDLKSRQSLRAVHARDCGSYLQNDVRIVPNLCDLSITDVAKTIEERENDNYNEWVICDYAVIGIFAAYPFYISALEVPSFPSDMPEYLRPSAPQIGIAKTSPNAIAEEFSDLRVFSFIDGQLVCFEKGNWLPADHHEL